MVIYEVNLDIEPTVYLDYMKWLRSHVSEMLRFDGFREASLFEIESNGEKKSITVQYKVATRDDLENYFKLHAPKMRGEGLQKFEGMFSAHRRILHLTV